MYLAKPHAKQWLIDIETDGLSPSVIWVLCAINIGTGKEVTLTDPAMMRGWINDRLQEGCTFVGHNLLSFDVPVLNRLVHTRIAVSRCVDTLVLSMLYSPGLAGGHSLEAWGQRLGFPKTSFNDWSKLSARMVEYCLNDCRVNVRLFLRLSDRMRSVGFSERGCEIEHRAWSIIQRQRKAGFAFDVPRAHELLAEIRSFERELKEKIYEKWPPVLAEVGVFKRAFKKDGQHTLGYEGHLKQYPKIELDADGGYRAFDYVEFKLGSPKQRVEKLLELGWKPLEFTEKGSPQPTKKGRLSPSLQRFVDSSDNEEVKLLADWIAVNSRGNTISGWIDIQKEGFIHGSLWLAGTLRYRHDAPNTANIPAVRSVDVVDDAGKALIGEDGEKVERPLYGREGVFTYEARDLWVCRNPADRRLVGVDAKGIQLRILAEYLKDDDFTSAILSADPHAANQKRLGLSSRALTKTITYATLMGAGDAKIAAEAKVNLKQARAAKGLFFELIPGLGELIKRLKTELARSGRITLCDGSKIMVPSDHMVIPYLLQGDESRIMKQAMIYVDEQVRREKLDAIKVGDIHDEWQTDTHRDHITPFIDACGRSFPESGRSFGYSVPIECSAKVGLTWAETH